MGLACLAQQRGRPIDESAPRGSQLTTNLNQLGKKRDPLQDLEADFNQGFSPFSDKGSLDGVNPMPQTRRNPNSAIQSKKVKRLLEEKQNWVYMDPDDAAKGPKAEDIFDLPEYDKDGQEKKKQSPMEKFYDKLARAREGQTNAVGTAKALWREEDAATADDSRFDPLGLKSKSEGKGEFGQKEGFTSSDGLTQGEGALQRLFGADNSGSTTVAPATTKGIFSDVFGPSSASPAADATDWQKRRDMYQQNILDYKPAAVSVPQALGSADAFKPSSSSMDGYSSGFSSGFNPSASSISDSSSRSYGSSYGSSSYGSSLGSFGQPAAASLPKTEPFHMNPAPTFSIPKRTGL